MTTRERKKLEKFARGETRKQIAEKNYLTFKAYREKGLTHKEISKKMGMSIKTMEYYQRRLNKGFSKNATEEDVKKLAEYLDTVNIEKKPKPASVPDELELMPFTLDPIPSGTKYKTRSIQISEDVAQRLKDFTDAQIGYQSKAVISQIISKGLEIYGV